MIKIWKELTSINNLFKIIPHCNRDVQLTLATSGYTCAIIIANFLRANGRKASVENAHFSTGINFNGIYYVMISWCKY